MSDRLTKETRIHAGLHFIVETFVDYDIEAPWTTGDGWGKVRTAYTRFGKVAEGKKPGERIIHTDGNTAWLYDYADAMETAKRDRWGCKDAKPDMSPGQKAECAVNADIALIRGYLTGEWSYIGIRVTLADVAGARTDEMETVWGIETIDADYVESSTVDLIESLAKSFAGKSEIVKVIKLR